MGAEISFVPIAHIRNAYDGKFGIPRQSGLVEETESVIVFEKEFRDENALRGIEGFSHLWLLWYFSAFDRDGRKWSPTVRPPKLGGNQRVGVFATRSPNRPNPIGLSSVRLKKVKKTGNDGVVLIVTGADLMDGTPIFDIKPYLAYTDSHPDAAGGFTDDLWLKPLTVVFLPEAEKALSEEMKARLSAILAGDVRPSYQDDPEREYGMTYEGKNVRFRVMDGCVEVFSVT